MWIEPNGVVKILQNIDLDNMYDNTIYFTNRTAQFNYFNSKAKYTYNKISYQRVKRNYMRVEINAENLYDCNYLMFQNTNFGNRWFYAFITKVEYLSNMVSEIEYELDEMQTWFLNGNVEQNTSDCTMSMCFVEREHSVTDVIGENLIEENLELGEYIMNVFTPSYATLDISNKLLENQSLIVATTFDTNLDDYGGGMVNRIYSGLYYNVFPLTEQGIIDAQTFIDNAISNNKKEGIIDIFQVPEAMTLSIGGSIQDTEFNPYTYDWQIDKPLANIDGYYPKNNKLFTYPYTFLYVTDCHDNHAIYPFEYFNGSKWGFRYSFSISCDPSMQIAPLNYKGLSGANYNEKMVYKGFPHCSWDSDVWKAWLSQNGGTIGMGQITSIFAPLVTSMGALGASVVTANPLAGLGGAVGVLNTIKQVKTHETMPPQSKGNYNGDIIYANKINDFWYGNMHIRSEFAKIIDEYFTMFGYATKRLKVPNISSRPQWNYVKTIDANIFGNIPADSLRKIKDIFNRGITFWKNGDNIGNYSLVNSPV